jgi:hypothetical protein
MDNESLSTRTDCEDIGGAAASTAACAAGSLTTIIANVTDIPTTDNTHDGQNLHQLALNYGAGGCDEPLALKRLYFHKANMTDDVMETVPTSLITNGGKTIFFPMCVLF